MNLGTVSADIVANVGGFQKGMTEAQNQLREFGQKVGQFQTTMGNFGREMTTKVTLPIVAAFTGATKIGMDFNTSMTKLRTQVGLTEKEVAGVREEIMRLSPEVAIKPRELGEAYFFIASAGLRGADAMEVLKYAAQASALGLGDTKVVADLLTSAVNAYGVETLSASKATDILTGAVRLGKLEAPELAASMGVVLPMASNMGVQFHEVSAAMAAMSRTGTDAAGASTQLNAIFAGLLKVTPQAEEALDNVGLSGAGLRAELGSDGLLSVLQTLNDAFGDNEQGLEAVFGNVRALRGAFDLLGSNKEENEAIFEDMESVAGMTDEAFGILAETNEFKLQQALANSEKALIRLAETLDPYVKEVLESLMRILEKFIGWWEELSPDVKDGIVQFTALLAILGPVGYVLSGAGRFVGFLVKGFKFLAPAVTGSLGAIKGAGTGFATVAAGAGATAGAIGLVMGALTWLGIEIYAVAKNWQFYSQVFKSTDFFKELEATAKGIGRFFLGTKRTVIDDVREMSNEATAEVVAMSRSIEGKLLLLQISGEAISENMANGIIDTYNNMKARALQSIEEQYTESITGLEYLRDTAGLITEEQYQEMVAIETTRKEEQIQLQEDLNIAVTEKIRALQEGGVEITEEMRREIVAEMSNLRDSIIEITAEQTEESLLVITKLRNEGGKLTAEMAAQAIKDSLSAKNGTVKNAEEQYEENIRIINRMSNETIEATGKTKRELLQDAKNQRDGAVNEAEEMHKGVVGEVTKMAGESIKQVDTASGEILSGWGQFKRDFVASNEGIETETVSVWARFSTSMKELAKGIMDSIDLTKRKSPSAIDRLRKGIDLAEKEFARLGGIQLSPMTSMTNVSRGSDIISLRVDMSGAHISSAEVAEQYAEQMGNAIVNKLRSSRRSYA
jgi:TP901 family phage tail tape measure protein